MLMYKNMDQFKPILVFNQNIIECYYINVKFIEKLYLELYKWSKYKYKAYSSVIFFQIQNGGAKWPPIKK